MSVRWLVANNAYVILFGDSLVDIDGKRFFQSIKELKNYLKPKGLTVKNKTICKIEGAES
jgi:predicted transcriptional regulator